jgi:hypothetical protein
MLIGTNSGIRNQTFYFCIIFGEGSNALLVPFFVLYLRKYSMPMVIGTKSVPMKLILNNNLFELLSNKKLID